MQKKLEEFYEVLRRENIELDEVELAEVVWLATQIDNQTQRQSSLSDMFRKRLDNILSHLDFNFNFFNKKDEKNDEKEPISTPTTEISKRKKRHIKKRSNSAPLVASSSESQNTLSFRTPANNYLHKSSEWIHAFRHFKQKKELDNRDIFDEEKTADYIASSKIFVPQYKASYEKRFEAIFLVDISDSMEIWKELIDEFFKSIKSYGVFKSVTVYYLHSNSSFELYKAEEKRGKLNKNWYKNRENESLCFVLTDMLSQGWQSGVWLSSFEKWQSKFALSVVQMLPYHLWKGSILNRATVTKFEGEKVFGKNKYLKSRARVRDVNEKILKLPLLNLDANSFDKYGKVFLAKGKQRIDGAVFKLNKNYESKEKIKTVKTDAQRVEHFYRIASDEAIALAEYFSVIPLTFPVMKIVQEVLLPNSTQVHLSEVFMSGLIDKKHKQGDIYSFYNAENSEEGVREILLNLLGVSKAVETIVRISNYVSSSGGRFSFLAFLQDPNYLEKGGVSSEFDREFARISATLLEKMGGEYAKKAGELMEFIEYDEEDDIEEPEEIVTLITPTTKRFIMGSEDGEDREKPAHEVIINYDFEMAQTPVTVGEFSVFVEETGYVTEAEKGDGAYVYDGKDWSNKKDASWKNPYFEQTDKNPVVCVSWNDAQAYIKWLNEKTNETYRLPTEAEWEFSCRAGTTTKWHFDDKKNKLKDYAWYDENSENKTHPVGELKPNDWGLHDMHGNVWEWCLDDFEDNYNNTPRDGSEHIIETKEYKILRGGSWGYNAYFTRSAIRFGYIPSSRYVSVGFRLLRTLP